MTREEWARSLPNPISPAQIVERMQAARDATLPAALEITTSRQIYFPTKLADADRDSQKLIDGAKLFAANQPDTRWALDSDAAKNGMAIGLALFDGLDDLRRAAMGAPAAERITTPADVAHKAQQAAAAVNEVGRAMPTVAIIAGLLYLAHRFGGDD